MGYAICHGECYACRRIFSFNPLRVPSVVVEGTRQPLCASCVERANVLRRANGMPLIVPLPDAYDACDEGELG